MILKPGARILGIKPETWAIVLAADPIWQSYGLWQGVTISSGVDGKHIRASEHYAGLALDLRVHDLPDHPTTKADTFDRLKLTLGEDFDMFHEYIGTPEEHFHAHWNPKNPMK